MEGSTSYVMQHSRNANSHWPALSAQDYDVLSIHMSGVVQLSSAVFRQPTLPHRLIRQTQTNGTLGDLQQSRGFTTLHGTLRVRTFASGDLQARRTRARHAIESQHVGAAHCGAFLLFARIGSRDLSHR